MRTAALGDCGPGTFAGATAVSVYGDVGVVALGLVGMIWGTGNVVGGDASAVVDGGIGASSTNCFVKSPGGQPGTSISSATLVKSRSLNGK